MKWSLLLLLLIGSCSSLVWLYDNKGDANTNLVLGASNNTSTENETKKPISESNSLNSQKNTNNNASKSSVVYANNKDNRSISQAGIKNHLANSSSASMKPIVDNSSSIDVSKNIFDNTNIVAKKNTNTIDGAAIGLKPDNEIKDIVPATNKELENNTVLLKPDSAATLVADAKKKNDKKKTPETKGEKNWWRGPSYFKYSSETDMNNEESNWKFGASAGVEFPTVRFKGNSSDPLYFQFRKDDEKRAFSYNAQAFAVRQLGSSFLAQTGLGYSSFGFTCDYQHSIYSVRDSVTPQGNIIHDTTYSYKINAQSQYRVNYIEVPIIVGYHFGDYRVNFDFKLGYIFQLLASQNGSVLSPTSHQLEPIGAANQLSANRLGASGLISLRANYQIKHELSVFIEPTYRRNLNPLMGVASLQQYINSKGVNVGIKFHWD